MSACGIPLAPSPVGEKRHLDQRGRNSIASKRAVRVIEGDGGWDVWCLPVACHPTTPRSRTQVSTTLPAAFQMLYQVDVSAFGPVLNPPGRVSGLGKSESMTIASVHVPIPKKRKKI